jgi:hypothetical protein
MAKPVLSFSALCLLCFIMLQSHAPHYRMDRDAGLENPPPGCTDLNNEGFESGFGIWIDGGSNCARSNSFPNSGSWSVELRAGVGLTSAMYTAPQDYAGVGVTLSFSFYPVGYENGEGFVLEYATDANGTYTGFTGWSAGNQFVNNTRYNVTVTMNRVTWTSTSRLRLRSIASATDDRVYIDDVVISNCCEVGAACNDNSACTTNDVINSNCVCAGTYQDSDSDGTCDAFDLCPGLDDYLVTSEFPCDDGDPCTEGDHLDVDICGCQGTYVDWDGDGYCHNEDPDDVDACNPEPENPACNPCITHEVSHFESNFQIWNSGGNDCSRLYAPQYASAGNYCVRIRDNSGAISSMYTDNMNLAGRSNLSLSFSFIAVGMEANEDFVLEASTNGGSSYTVVESWSRGTDFENNAREFVWVSVPGITWTAQSRLRFRCDASANDDAVYIDDVIIKTCDNYPAMQVVAETVPQDVSNDKPEFEAKALEPDREEAVLSPNPVADELRITGIPLENASISVFTISGSLMPNKRLSENTVDVSGLLPGLYFIRIEKDGQVVIKRFIKN